MTPTIHAFSPPPPTPLTVPLTRALRTDTTASILLSQRYE